MHGGHYRGLTAPSKAGTVWTGKIAPAPDSILWAPFRWKKPRRIFLNSMSDLFHEDVPDELIDRVFAVMALTPQHTYQVLTKRAERMREYMRPFDRRRAEKLGAEVSALRECHVTKSFSN
jgi:protein gp37